MMIQGNQRFQEDIKRYEAAIDRLSDEKDKLEAKKLLTDLIFEVKKMDSMFLDMIYSKQMKSMGTEFKDSIVNLRRKLESKLKSVKNV